MSLNKVGSLPSSTGGSTSFCLDVFFFFVVVVDNLLLTFSAKVEAFFLFAGVFHSPLLTSS